MISKFFGLGSINLQNYDFDDLLIELKKNDIIKDYIDVRLIKVHNNILTTSIEYSDEMNKYHIKISNLISGYNPFIENDGIISQFVNNSDFISTFQICLNSNLYFGFKTKHIEGINSKIFHDIKELDKNLETLHIILNRIKSSLNLLKLDFALIKKYSNSLFNEDWINKGLSDDIKSFFLFYIKEFNIANYGDSIVSHGDMNPQNIIERCGQLFFIDFEDCIEAPKYYDLIYYCTFDKTMSLIPSVVSHIKHIHSFDNIFSMIIVIVLFKIYLNVSLVERSAIFNSKNLSDIRASYLLKLDNLYNILVRIK